MTETPQTPTPQQALAELIDAYASAKASGNETLQRLAVKPLQDFLNSYDLILKGPSDAEIAEAIAE